MKKSFLILLAFISFLNSYSQHKLSDYKYVIVPKQYQFQNEPGQYRINDLVKFMFKKVGFESFIEGEQMPEDLKYNFCLALRAEIETSGLIKTKSVIKLVDCNRDVIFSSREGVSKEKEFKKAYNLSIRDAFKSFESINYEYIPNDKYRKSQTPSEDEEITKLKAEIKELKKKEPVPLATGVVVGEKALEDKKEIQTQLVEENNSEVKKVEDINIGDKQAYTVKKISNGFILLDGNSNKGMTIFESGMKDVFIVKGKDAIIYKKGDSWLYSETNEANLITKIINIKF